MRILFLSPSLEPGRSGVGDCVRQLANHFAEQGTEVAAISLNEATASFFYPELPPRGDNSFKILRCSAAIPWIERVRLARTFAQDFRPDWISLHFVCYGFQPRGLVRSLGQRLAPLLRGYRLEIMMHELWVMWRMDCRLADRLTGILQRRFVLQFLRAVRPRVLHTHLTAYQAELRHAGFQPEYLPLAGSIPVQSGEAREWVETWLSAQGVEAFFEHRERFWLFGVFGMIYDGWDPICLMRRIIPIAARVGRRPVFLSFGGVGERGRGLWGSLGAAFPGEIILRIDENLPEKRVSECVNSLDFGLTSYSPDFFEKSSAGITMIEHGLPMVISKKRELCVDASTFSPPLDKDRWIIADDGDFEQRLLAAKRRQPQSRLELVATKFVSDLKIGQAN